MEIVIGSIVRRTDGQPLRSGCQAYGGAICVSTDPFIAVSERADMRWNHLDISEFHTTATATATALQLQLANTRL